MGHLANSDREQARLADIFFPIAQARVGEVRQLGTRFVHYTSADAAVKILKGREVWMRKADTMNDFMEIEHGIECLVAAYKGAAGQRLQAALEIACPGVCSAFESHFNGWLPHFKADAYLFCVSEHREDEDAAGRLSMWRAYGGATGVALVLNNNPFLTETDALKAYSSPVAYLSEQAFSAELSSIAEGLEANVEILRAAGSDAVLSHLTHMMKYAVLCTKHPGFREELEWRVIYSPAYAPSDRLRLEVEVIRGTPQRVAKIPLKNYPEEGLLGIEVPQLLDRIIVGPTRFPAAIHEALVHVLQDAGVADASRKVVISDIPLREAL